MSNIFSNRRYWKHKQAHMEKPLQDAGEKLTKQFMAIGTSAAVLERLAPGRVSEHQLRAAVRAGRTGVMLGKELWKAKR